MCTKAKKEIWDETTRDQPYKLGDYVLIKNKNPASGPGKRKLRAKYIGPFRVIKVYYSSVVVVPWTQNARLDEYYKDPNLFRLMHRGDIRPFHVTIVSVQNCKPFKGDIYTEEVIDPIMLSRFLDDLGIENGTDIISVIDSDDTIISTGVNSDSTTTSTTSSSSSSNHPPPPNGPGNDPKPRKPRYDDPDPPKREPRMKRDPFKDEPDDSKGPHKREPFVCSPEMEDFINNLYISEDDKNLLREYCQVKDDLEEAASYKSSRRLDKIKDFIQNADPVIRDRAEYELEQVLNDMKYLRKSGMLDRMSQDYRNLIRKSPSNADRTVIKTPVQSDDESEPIQANIPASVHGSNTESSDENESLGSFVGNEPNVEEIDTSSDTSVSRNSDLTWDHGHDIGLPIAPNRPVREPIPDININLPNVNINIRQPRAGMRTPPTANPVAARTPAAQENVLNPFQRAAKLNRTPVEGVSRQQNVRDWIEGRSPQHGPDPATDLASPHGNPEVTPLATRSGRISKPPARFDPTAETKLQSDLRAAVKKSLAEQRIADTLAAKAAKIKASRSTIDAGKASTSKPPDTVVPEKSKKAATAKTIASQASFKPISKSRYDQLSLRDKMAYNEAKERDAASKTAASTKATVVESEKSKSTTAKSKPVDTESRGGDPVKATSDIAPDVDITARSSKTARTPVKDDTSTRTTKTNPSGANRLSDNDDPIFD